MGKRFDGGPSTPRVPVPAGGPRRPNPTKTSRPACEMMARPSTGPRRRSNFDARSRPRPIQCTNTGEGSEDAVSMVIVGVMGPGGGATDRDCAFAYELGCAIAREGWVLLTGGRAAGVMNAATRGAKEAGGLTIGGVAPRHKAETSPLLSLPLRP